MRRQRDHAVYQSAELSRFARLNSTARDHRDSHRPRSMDQELSREHSRDSPPRLFSTGGVFTGRQCRRKEDGCRDAHRLLSSTVVAPREPYDLGEERVDGAEAFEVLDMRVGRVLRVEPNEKARKPAYRLWIDFGELGTRTSSAQLTDLYPADELVGRLVIAAVNLGTRLVAGFRSEVLVLGVPDEHGAVVLLQPD